MTDDTTPNSEYHYVQIRVTKKFNEKIDKYVEDHELPSKTAFIIQALDFYMSFGEKLERIHSWVSKVFGN